VHKIIVGTKIDLRDDKKYIAEMEKKGDSVVTKAMGEQLAKDLGAVGYVECSARNMVNVKEVFHLAMKLRLADVIGSKKCVVS